MPAFKFYTPQNTQGDTHQLLSAIKQQYGFVPNLFGFMAEAPHTIEAYGYLNNLLNHSDLSGAHQQLALLAVSVYHKCDFCRVAHHGLAQKAQANAQSIDALLNGEAILDPKDKALVDMIIAIVDKRGWVEDSELDTFLQAGFSHRHIYDLILITSLKTLSNYANHLTRPEPNPELKAMIT